jgi:hypothetical protein
MDFSKEVEINTEELLLAEIKDGCTAYNLAAIQNKVETLKKLWVWAEETQINPKEMKKKLLLATDDYGYTAWTWQQKTAVPEVLETLWYFAKEAELNTHELSLAKPEDGHNVFELAAYKNHVEMLNKLLVWAEEMQISPKEMKKNCFQAKTRVDPTLGMQP